MHVVEKNPPPAATAIKWLLFTTVQVASAKQVLKCVRWYVRRWRIEEWQRVMKSGSKILEHQNRDATVLLRAIARDAVIAWRIMLLALMGRTAPGLPADLVFDAGEGEVLQLLTSKKLSVGEAMIAVAQLAGYLHRAGHGRPVSSVCGKDTPSCAPR